MSVEGGARGAARRAAILDAARTIVIEDGLERFVLRHVARCAGITLGNLQYYFATRDDLLEAVVRAEFDRDLATLQAAVGADPAGDPAGELAAISRRLVEQWCTGGSNICIALTQLAFHDDRYAALNAEIYQRFSGELGGLIRRIDPAASDDDVRARTFLVTALLDGVTIQVHATRTEDLDEMLAQTTAAVTAIATGAALGVSTPDR